MKWYFRYCCYIRDYYARTEGEGTGEAFGAFLVSTILLYFNISSLILFIEYLYLDKSFLLEKNAYLLASVFLGFTIIFNYLIAFKGNRYMKYCDDRIKGYQVFVYIVFTIAIAIAVTTVVRNRKTNNKINPPVASLIKDGARWRIL